MSTISGRAWRNAGKELMRAVYVVTRGNSGQRSHLRRCFVKTVIFVKKTCKPARYRTWRLKK